MRTFPDALARELEAQADFGPELLTPTERRTLLAAYGDLLAAGDSEADAARCAVEALLEEGASPPDVVYTS